MRINPVLSLGLCCLIFTACAGSIEKGATPQTSSFEMSIAYYNDDGDALGHMVNGEQILLLFPSIKGQIFGVPKRPILTEVTVSDNQPFKVELPNMNTLVAASLSDSEWTQGISIVPSETKILRAATMAFDKKSRKPFAAGSLINPKTGDNLILMYFNMPCSITGLVQSGDMQYRHQIKIKTAGWHWIAGTQPAAGISTLRALSNQPNNVEFAITVDGMLAL